MIFDIHDKEDNLSIKIDFSQLLDLYSPAFPCISSSVSSYPKTLIDCLSFDWKIFSNSLLDYDIDKILRFILGDNYDINYSLFSTTLVMTQLQDRKFQKENSIFKENGWKEFKEVLLHKNRFFNTEVETELLKSCLVGLN